jgi:hypothetical protein
MDALLMVTSASAKLAGTRTSKVQMASSVLFTVSLFTLARIFFLTSFPLLLSQGADWNRHQAYTGQTYNTT